MSFIFAVKVEILNGIDVTMQDVDSILRIFLFLKKNSARGQCAIVRLSCDFSFPICAKHVQWDLGHRLDTGHGNTSIL